MTGDDNGSFSYFKGVFIPLVVMLAAATCGGFFLSYAVSLQFPPTFSPDVMGLFQFFSLIISTCLAIFFILLTRKIPMQTWFPALLFVICATIGIAAMGLNLSPTENVASDNWLSTSMKGYFSEPLHSVVGQALRQWQLGAMVLLSSLFSPTLLVVIVWGFANQITRLREAMSYYIALLFFASLPSWFLPFMIGKLSAFNAMLLALGCLIATLVLFIVTCKRLPAQRWQEDSSEITASTNRFGAILAFGILIAGFGIVKQFTDPIFTSLLKAQYQDHFLDLSPFMASFSFWAGMTALTVCILSLLLGPWLLKRYGWKAIALISPMAVLLSLIVIVAGSNDGLVPLGANWFNQGLLMGLKGSLLIPIIQIAYLFFSKDNRFQMNAWATIIVAPLLQGIGYFTTQNLLLYHETFPALNGVLILLAALTLVLMIAAIIYLSIKPKALELQEA